MLHYIGADKEPVQAAVTQIGAVAPVLRLCGSSQPEIQAAAADVVRVLSRHAGAALAVVDCGQHLHLCTLNVFHLWGLQSR